MRICVLVCSPARCLCVCEYAYAYLCLHKHTCVHVGVHAVCTCIACVLVHVCAYACIFACGWAAGVCASVCLWGPVFVCVCRCGGVFCPRDQYPVPRLVEWFTRETVQTKLNRKQTTALSTALAPKPRGSTLREGRLVSWLRRCWFGTSHQCYISEEEKQILHGRTESRAEAQRIWSRHVHWKTQTLLYAFQCH